MLWHNYCITRGIETECSSWKIEYTYLSKYNIATYLITKVSVIAWHETQVIVVPCVVVSPNFLLILFAVDTSRLSTFDMNTSQVIVVVLAFRNMSIASSSARAGSVQKILVCSCNVWVATLHIEGSGGFSIHREFRWLLHTQRVCNTLIFYHD